MQIKKGADAFLSMKKGRRQIDICATALSFLNINLEY